MGQQGARPAVPVSEPEQVRAWARAGESDSQEFKTSTGSARDACETLTAFLNLRGGRVLFGVTPTGQAVGQQVTDHTLEKIYSHLREIAPEVTPDVERVPLGLDSSVEFVVVSVPQGRFRPYLFKGKPYKRVGTVTTEMGPAEHDRLVLETHHATERWETQPTALTLDDLDLEELLGTVRDAVERGRVLDPLSRDPLDLLRGFGLVRGEQLLNAAVVLFGREDRLLPDYAQCLVKLVRWDGHTKGEHMLEQRQDHGNAFQILRRAERFCREHL